jgi:hypothetical protein
MMLLQSGQLSTSKYIHRQGVLYPTCHEQSQFQRNEPCSPDAFRNIASNQALRQAVDD